MSNSTDNEYFSDGLTEEIINALAKIKELSVTSRTSSFYFKDKKVTSKEIGKSLGVGIILEGSVRFSKSKMRVTTQLIDTQNDYHFWSKTFDRDLEDIFEVQDEISLFIAEKLREHIGHLNIDKHLVFTPNIKVSTYKKYLKGRFYLMKLGLKNTTIAIETFQEVINEQPNFINPYLDINQGYTYLGTMGLIPAIEGFMKAQPYLQKALKLNPNSAKSQLNLSWIECWQNWNLEKAFKHASNALEIQPSDEIYLTISNLLTVQGKLDAAQNYIDKALELDPFSGMNHHYKGFLYYLQEDFNNALKYLYKSLKLSPDLPFSPLYIGECLLLSNRAAEALEYFQNLSESSQYDLTKLGGITMAHAVLGNQKEVKKGIQELENFLESEAKDKAFNFLILINVLLKNSDKAINLIEEAFNNHLPLILLLNTEPIVKLIRNEKPFKEIMLKAIKDNSTYNIKRKYKKSLLTKNEVEKYTSQLEKIMQDYKPYLNPDITLNDIASYLELPSNYTSQLLNEGFNKNFSEYINTYRINEFKKRITLPESKNLTILAVAYDSGFNSKTSFNTFFKKIQGVSPNTYLKSML
ncbi:MAG: helix-turn-helix domain-containing protein [Lutibacter sp.]|nr:helix-turn-helix domain-containing protein [Lutibacter sp.]